jgi:hypothetical protein
LASTGCWASRPQAQAWVGDIKRISNGNDQISTFYFNRHHTSLLENHLLEIPASGVAGDLRRIIGMSNDHGLGGDHLGGPIRQ